MVLHIKKFIPFLLLCLGILVLSGCAAAPSTQTVAPSVDQTNFPWAIELNRWEVASDLNGSQSVMEYNGDSTSIQLNEKPSDGNTFLLVELTVKKQIAGSSTFKWEYLSVKDETGSHYSRMQNDTFLESYNFPRLKSTDLTFGENKGFICFEIPQDTASDTITLVYESPDETIELPLQ